MDLHSHMKDDFWDDITEQLCATIVKESINYDADWLDRAFEQNEREGQSMLEEPSLAQAGEDAEYAKSLEVSCASEGLSQATEFTTDQGKDEAAASLAEAGPNSLNFPSRSHRDPQHSQHAANGGEGTIRPPPVPTHQLTMSHSNPSTITISDFPVVPTTKAWEYLSGPSPTPATTTNLEAIEESSPPTTPTVAINARPLKRKLSFGIPVFAGDGEVKMPPSKLRRVLPSIEDQIFSEIFGADTIATHSEVMFKGSPGASVNDKKAPKTPVLVEFGLPSSPIFITDDKDPSYPKCCDGLLMEIPLHHLISLRKAVDPAFHNDRYWGDGLYFREEPVYSLHCDQSEAYGFHRADWRIIFHALDNDADKRIPLPDTTTQPRLSAEQLHKTWLSFKGAYKEKAIMQAQMSRDWTKAQIDKSGVRWTGIRGSHYRDPPEFCVTSSQDMCVKPEFRIFCTFARFVGGRPAEMPKELALRDTLSVLRYARLRRVQCSPEVCGHDQQQTTPFAQHVTASNAGVIRHDAVPFGSCVPLYLSTSPTSVAAPQDLPHASLSHLQQLQRSVTPAQNIMPLVYHAFHDIRSFMSLPQETLNGIRQQWLQGRAERCVRQGLPVPNTVPTALQVWQFFRQNVMTKTIGRRERAIREAAAGEEAQASMLRNPFTGQASTPISSRSVQLESHMPTIPVSQSGLRTNSTRNMVAAATPLGSPFLTPGRMRDDNIDPWVA